MKLIRTKHLIRQGASGHRETEEFDPPDSQARIQYIDWPKNPAFPIEITWLVSRTRPPDA
jgi:hypothetical protein